MAFLYLKGVHRRDGEGLVSEIRRELIFLNYFYYLLFYYLFSYI